VISIRVELLTPRLRLRPFAPGDAPDVVRLAGDVAIARDTINIPHPYLPGDAAAWIDAHPDQLARGEAVTMAVTRRPHDELVGAATLIIEPGGRTAELGYWIGRPYWGQGYATEAARALLVWGFRVAGIERIHAGHFTRNAASGAVLRKLGMRYEGRLPRHTRKDGEYLDLERYAMARSELGDGP
jgi:[ribosomal protein S5]-alanine N-acetyltransferase